MSSHDTNIVEAKKLERYSVGDCEMLARANGSYIRVDDLIDIITWLEDEDNSSTILIKLDYLRDALS